MKQTLQTMQQHMVGLFWKIVAEKEDITLDGVPGYNEKAQFVGGKVINFSCYVVLELLKDTADYERGLAALKDVIRMVSGMKMETWGILNGVIGLRRLQLAGLLPAVVEADTMDVLKASMDWRTFVDVSDNYALIDKPTNYYGVAFGIARHREMLGWEPEGYTEILLNCLMRHIESYSGEFCYMDETKGEGRFDRYSILIPSEVTSLLLAGGMEIPELIHKMLNNSAHIFLNLANRAGTGFSYGRSIGAYGDTAALEVLSAAALLPGIYTEEEKTLALGYSLRIVKEFVSFWHDEDMQSINMWDKGRKTDNYRNKNRILGENLSLHMQVINCLEHWTKAGIDNFEEPEGWEELLETLDARSFIRFSKHDYDRGLVIVRDSLDVWSLPLINGGTGYYDKDPYLPVPRQNYVSEGVPECRHGAMVPQVILADDRRLMPIAYITDIDVKDEDGVYTVVCKQNNLCLTGGKSPQPADDASVVTTYRFRSGMIEREDVFHIGSSWDVKEIILEFQTFSNNPNIKDALAAFSDGSIRSMAGSGYDTCETEGIEADGSHDTPHGRLNSRIVWRKHGIPENGTVRVQWQMNVNGENGTKWGVSQRLVG